MTAPFGEELAVVRPIDALAKGLHRLATSSRRFYGKKYPRTVVSILTIKGKKQTTWRRFAWLQRLLWCGASHDTTFENMIVRTPQNFCLQDFGNFACGVVVPSGELIVRLQYARDDQRRFVQRFGSRDIQYQWQVMPLDWLSEEEIAAITTSLRRLSSKARAF